jgi:N-acetylmuramoyl-L-alanine amidase
LYEHLWTYDFGIELQQFIEKWHPSVNVSVTRSWPGDGMRLTQRGIFSRLRDADLVLSLHINAMVWPLAGARDWYESDKDYREALGLAGKLRPDVDGAMAFVLPDDPGALSIAQAWTDALPRPLRRAGPNPWVAEPKQWFDAVRNCLLPHEGRTPVLMECGFATSPRDRGYLLSADGRRNLLIAFGAAVGRAVDLRLA